jgi:hypothetical protein
MFSMWEIKRLSKGSLSRVTGLMGAIFGFFYGLLTIAVMELLIGTGLPFFSVLKGYHESIGVATLFMFPLAFGVAGATLGGLFAGAYNLVSRYTGGVRFELNEVKGDYSEIEKPALSKPKLKLKG